MTDDRFTICFDGTIASDADPLTVRQRLQAMFKLDDIGIARLFNGKPVIVKRNVSAATAAQFERAFTQAGAVVQILSAESADIAAPPEDMEAAKEAEPTAERASVSAIATAVSAPIAMNVSPGLSLAPQESFHAAAPELKMPAPDTSHLSLVSAPDWTLEDCESTPDSVRLPDTSQLSLVEKDPVPDS